MMTCLEGFVSQLLLHKVYFIQDGAILRKEKLGERRVKSLSLPKMC